MKQLFTFILLISMPFIGYSQKSNGGIKGIVYNGQSGEPISFAYLRIIELKENALTDMDGYYSFSKIPVGSYNLRVNALGYDTFYTSITIDNDITKTKNLYIDVKSIRTKTAKFSQKRKNKLVKVQISKTTIGEKDLKRLPTVGGEPDLVQYLQILPGVVFTGDQGGQLYIRGGSPIMNKVILDGMTIYNPFHSIGIFSVFDADLIKSTDVYSAGFGAEYGGRISAIVDVKTRTGSRTGFKGKIAVNPFTSKVLLEGPLKKFKRGQNSSSFALSYKTSYLDKSSKLFYDYADPGRMPYSFSDIYAKVAFNSATGSNSRFFGFNFKDKVNFENSTSYEWNSTGFGGKFLMLPSGSKTRIDGVLAYSTYKMRQEERDNYPRESSINGYNVGLNFGYKIKRDDFKYGIELNGFSTNFSSRNSYNRAIGQEDNTTEISGFMQYRFVKRKWVSEIGLRAQVYSSLGNNSFEPRIAFKYLFSPEVRFKIAGGIYSQNLLSAISDRDVVNNFYGFLSGPDNLPETFDGNNVTHRLQKANHAVAGFEFDIGSKHEINIEAYIKDFTQITNINRDKVFENTNQFVDQPERLKRDYILESGKAYGGDFTYKFEDKKFYLWAVYSLNFVERFDEVQTYNPHFDRRHNLNLLGSVFLDKNKSTTFSVRWNFGSGFPFTQTQGFFEKLLFKGGISNDYKSDNGELGILYGELNNGRLPYIHRMDISLKKVIKLKKNRELELNASVTNVYDRNNIFYFDRIRYERVDQLPILPSIGMSYSF